TFLNRPNLIVSVIMPPKEKKPPLDRPASAGRDRGQTPGPVELLDLDLGAGVLELLRELVGLFLRNARLDRLAALVDEILRLLEAQGRDRTDDLDDVDLVRAGVLQDDVEGRLDLLRRRRSRRRGAAATAAAARRRLHAELVLELLHGRRQPQHVLLGHELGQEL